MFVGVWIFFVGLTHLGTGLNHQTQYERTRYVSSKNQIYGGDFEEKYIPFVHYWERPLQVLESSMKIPKKHSSRPLFSWDIPVQISTYTPSRRISTTEHSPDPVTETNSPETERKSLDPDSNAIPALPKTTQRSRSDRAKASVAYPETTVRTKKKKTNNRKKSIQELEQWKEPSENKTGVKGRLKRKKKTKKNRKGKLEKNGKRRKPVQEEKIKEMNDQVVELNPEFSKKNAVVREMQKIEKPVPTGQPPSCASEDKCQHRCEMVNGKPVCVCFKGFTLKNDRCVDINECETNNGGCNGKCLNTIGSKKCICSAGFRYVDGSCSDINECLLRNGHGPCQDRCTNTMGSYYCSCEGLPGTRLSSDKHTCENTRTCNLTSAGCSHSCISISGTAFCTCPEGMELGNDWKTCHDIDECSSPEDYDVHCEFGCVNTIGSYTCATRNQTSASMADSS